jgi:hypothetical protein
VAAEAPAAPAKEKVKLLASFEPDQLKAWGLDKPGKNSSDHYWGPQDESSYRWSDSGGAGGRVRKGEASLGEWALFLNVDRQSQMDYINTSLQNEWVRYGNGGIAKWAGHFQKWFPIDWSGYNRLRMDVKSSKAAVRVRVMLFDEIALPPAVRVFPVPAGEWTTLDFDLATASKLHELTLSADGAKRLGVKTAKLRMFNPARMADMVVLLEHTDGLTEVFLDHVRLVAGEQDESPKYKLVSDTSPFPQPKELPVVAPKPHLLPAPVKAAAGKPEPVVVDLGKARFDYDRLAFGAITAPDANHMLLCHGGQLLVTTATADNGKSWKELERLRHTVNAPGVATAPDGADVVAVYAARCATGGAPTDFFCRRALFDGSGWTFTAPGLVDVDSWHCPEWKMRVLRLPSGRIWSAWFQDGRLRRIHVKARYSDDDGATWRDPDSNGLYVYDNRQETKGPLPLGVTWWWEEPNLTPAPEKANGRLGSCEFPSNLLLTPYADQVACIWGNDNKLVWSAFDGKDWAEPKVVLRLYGLPLSAATLGDKGIHVVFRDPNRGTFKVLRLDGEQWVEDAPAGQGPDRLIVAGKTLLCVGKQVSTADGKQVTELWVSRKAAGGAWSAPETFAKEETKAGADGRITLAVSPTVTGGSVPVAWGPPREWVKIVRLAGE